MLLLRLKSTAPWYGRLSRASEHRKVGTATSAIPRTSLLSGRDEWSTRVAAVAGATSDARAAATVDWSGRHRCGPPTASGLRRHSSRPRNHAGSRPAHCYRAEAYAVGGSAAEAVNPARSEHRPGAPGGKPAGAAGAAFAGSRAA